MFDEVFYQALEVLEPLAPSGAGGAGGCLDDALGALRVMRGGLDALEAGLVTGLEPAVAIETLTITGKVSGPQARKVAARAELLADAPQLAAGLASGAVAGEQIDAVAKVAAGLQPEARTALIELGDDLVSHGAKVSPEEFGREVRRLGDMLSGDEGLARFEQQRRATRLRRGVDRLTGMHWLHGELDPETGSALFTALQRQLDTWFHHPDQVAATAVVAELVDDQEHLAAHALTQLCTQGRTGDSDDGEGGADASGDRRRPPPPVTFEVSVLCDLQTMRSGLHAASICETSSGVPLPPETVRRMACDAKILPIVMNGRSLPIDLGRSQRVANRTQRRALRAAHRTCVVPGCTVAFDWCQIHHLPTGSNSAPLTSPTWLRFAIATTTWSTKAAGPSPWTSNDERRCGHPTPAPTHHQPSEPGDPGSGAGRPDRGARRALPEVPFEHHGGLVLLGAAGADGDGG